MSKEQQKMGIGRTATLWTWTIKFSQNLGWEIANSTPALHDPVSRSTYTSLNIIYLEKTTCAATQKNIFAPSNSYSDVCR